MGQRQHTQLGMVPGDDASVWKIVVLLSTVLIQVSERTGVHTAAALQMPGNVKRFEHLSNVFFFYFLYTAD